MKPENHDQSAKTVACENNGPLPTRVIRLYQKSGIKEFSEDEIVTKYAPLVLKMVHRIAPITRSVVDFDDLKNVAFCALIQSARSFDPNLGVAFEVYCKHRIRGAILDELRKNSSVSRSVYARWKKLERTIQDLEEKLGKPATEREIAAELEISVEEYRGLLDDLRLVGYVSLDEISSPEAENGDYVPFQLEDLHQEDPAAQTSSRDLQELIRNRILQMTPQHKKILTLYYYEGLRFKDIALILKVTESRVCQIHTEAIMSLRAFLDREECLVNKT